MPPLVTSVPSLSAQRYAGAKPSAVPLTDHPTQSVTPIDGYKSILFSLPFLICGLFVIYASLHVSNVHSRNRAPVWLVVLIGSIFALSGLFFAAHGIHGLVRRALYNRDAHQNPGQPWLFDFQWQKDGASFSAFRAMLARFAAVLAWYVFLVPFFYIGATVRGGFMFLAVAGLFALCGIYFWHRWAQMVGELFRYGNSFLAYDQFPFFLGGALRVRLRAPAHIDSLTSLTFTFRCIEERYVTSGYRGQRSTTVVCYELYQDAITLEGDRLANYAGGEIPIEFRVPADKPSTSLSDTPPTYWEIQVRGQSASVNYDAFFLVPVYKST
jgi:hypothetical protein